MTQDIDAKTLEQLGNSVNRRYEELIIANGGWVKKADEVLADGETTLIDLNRLKKLRHVIAIVGKMAEKAKIRCPDIMIVKDNQGRSRGGYNRIYFDRTLLHADMTRLSAVSAHELAHVIRNDWYNYSKGYHHEIEYAANDLAMELLDDPKVILDHLINNVKSWVIYERSRGKESELQARMAEFRTGVFADAPPIKDLIRRAREKLKTMHIE